MPLRIAFIGHSIYSGIRSAAAYFAATPRPGAGDRSGSQAGSISQRASFQADTHRHIVHGASISASPTFSTAVNTGFPAGVGWRARYTRYAGTIVYSVLLSGTGQRSIPASWISTPLRFRHRHRVRHAARAGQAILARGRAWPGRARRAGSSAYCRDNDLTVCNNRLRLINCRHNNYFRPLSLIIVSPALLLLICTFILPGRCANRRLLIYRTIAGWHIIVDIKRRLPRPFRPATAHLYIALRSAQYRYLCCHLLLLFQQEFYSRFNHMHARPGAGPRGLGPRYASHRPAFGRPLQAWHATGNNAFGRLLIF